VPGIVSESRRTIDGRAYTFRQWTATESLERMPVIVALLGEDLLGIVIEAGKDTEQLLLSAEVLGAAIVKVAKNATAMPGGLVGVARDLLHGVSVESEQITGAVADNFDALFTGDLGLLLKLASEQIKASFTRP